MKSIVLITLLAAELAFLAATSQPIDAGLLRGLLVQSSPIFFLAIGMTFVILTAGIDLSVGSMTALVAAVLASFPAGGSFWATAVPAGLAAALLLGATNGALVARLDMPPIVATLGTMLVFRGLAYGILGDSEKGPFAEVPGYFRLGEVEILGAVVLVAAVSGGVLYYASRWSRELHMIGGNRIAARYAGVPVLRRQMQVYTLAGACAFLAAVAYTAQNGSVSASALPELELKVITAVVLGGTRVQGGSGSYVGSLLGVFVIALLDEGLRGAKRWGDEHLPFDVSYLRHLALGVLLAGGVGIHGWWGRRALRSPRGRVAGATADRAA